MRGVYLGVLNKLLTHIHNIHTLHKEIIVENLVQPVLFTHIILQGAGRGGS